MACECRFTVFADGQARRRLLVPVPSSLTLDVGSGVDLAYSLDNGTLGPLPVGALFDPFAGRFTWIPPADTEVRTVLVFVKGALRAEVEVVTVGACGRIAS